MALLDTCPAAPRVAARVDRAALTAAGALILGALGYGIVAQGGFYAGARRGLALALVAAAISAWATGRIGARDLRAPWVLAAGALAGWAVLSGLVGGDLLDGLVVGALLVGLVGVVLVVRSTAGEERALFGRTLLLAGVAVGAVGWFGVVWRWEPFGLVDGGLWRAASPLTYANATAAFLVPVALFALGLLVRDRRDSFAALAAFVALVGTGATQSRAGMLGLVVGFVVLLVAAGGRRVLAASWPVLMGAAVAVVGLIPTTMAWGPPHREVAVPAFVLGAALAVGARRLPKRAWVLVALAAAVVIPFTGVVHKLTVAHDFMAPDRLSADSPDRGREWSATWDLARRHPVTGVGPGNFVVSFAHDGQTFVAEFAHNEYLQLLAEEGVVAVAFLGVAALALSRAVWRRRQDADRALWAGAVAGCCALAVHSGLDFVWHLPVVPIVGAVLVGLALASTTDQTPMDLNPQKGI